MSINLLKCTLVIICLILLFTMQIFAQDSQKTPLLTKWAKTVNANNVHPEYPRPQLVRDSWQNLNGMWDYAIRPKGESKPEKFDGKILVPFAVESELSGVKKSVGADNTLWYRRSFTVSEDWRKQQIRLNFGAVDWETTVWVNGKEIGVHKGGYDPFSFDITAALKPSGQQIVELAVWDPIDKGTQPRGKQVQKPRGIWYTSVTGIWQTVWLEPVNATYVRSLSTFPFVDEEQVKIVVGAGRRRSRLLIEAIVSADGKEIGRKEVPTRAPLTISIKNAKLWSPQSPFLYDLKIILRDSDRNIVDSVKSYFGMRKMSLGKDKNGLTRMLLNDEFIFQFGPLDQGWWPDGLYTAPTDEALRYDIEVTKKLGFNMARKHVKIEPARWYYWCDKLGLMVWQDMPSGDAYIDRGAPDIERTPESAGQFEREIRSMVGNLINHPSIVVWVAFNEGWGQFQTWRTVTNIKQADPTRLVINTSGWADRGVGDIHDIHAYPGPAMPEPEEFRAIVLGEFGGLGLPVEGHTWQDKDNWGYRKYDDKQKLTNAYRELIKNLHPFILKGLSAAVYTQTTDVEIEVNGLMTYDRALIKMDSEEVNRINNILKK